MAEWGVALARRLLDAGRYTEAANLFIASGELASAARAFVAAKDLFQAAVCYEKALKPLDAARLYQQTRHWSKAAELYAMAGDKLRADMALEQLKKERDSAEPGPVSAAVKRRPPKEPQIPWPAGEIWQAIRSGDTGAAVKLYLRVGGRSGWELVNEATSPGMLRALAEMLFLARDHAVAAEAFQKAGDLLRSAQCLSLAGLNEDAAHIFFNLGQKATAAQHFEKAHAWEQAADIYIQEGLFVDAARCHEKGDDPVRAAAMYLKAKKLDLALPLLQSVPPTHRNFSACRILASKIMLQKGQKDLAVSMVSPLLEKISQTEDGLETYYQAAVVLEQAGALDHARRAYENLQQMRFGFKNVGERLQKLPASGPPSPPSPPSPRSASAPSGVAGAAAPSATAPAKAEATPLPALDLAPLRDCSLFNRLGNEELRRIWMIGRTGTCVPGKVILKAGDFATGLIVVLSGGITITPDPSNVSVASGFLGPGDYVGLGSLLKGPPHRNALVAQGGTRLLVLPFAALESLLSAEPELGMRFYRSVAEHLVQTLMAENARSLKA